MMWNDYWHMPWMFIVPLVFMVLCGAMMFFMMGGHTPGSDRATVMRSTF